MNQNNLKNIVRIKELLTQETMIDFSIFTNKEALSQISSWLEVFLKEARKDFAALLLMSPHDACYENTAFAYLTSGRPLGILYAFIETLNSVDAQDITRQIVEKFEPKIIAFTNEVMLNKKFYSLLTIALKKTRQASERRSIECLMTAMKHAGVLLDDTKRVRVARINKRLSTLGQKFENNSIDSRKTFSAYIVDESVLGYMPTADKSEAREMAKKQGNKKGYVFTLLPPHYAAIMKYCTDREIRKRFYNANTMVATQAPFDNRKLILEILTLRNAKARLLGHPHFARYALELRMAPSEKKVFELLDKIFKKARPAAQKECVLLEKYAKNHCEVRLSQESSFEEWDVSFYADRYRRTYFEFDEAKIREYFELSRIIDGLFLVCNKLYGLTFKKIHQGAYAKNVEVFEVYRNGECIAYYIADFFARPSKRGGAWCNVLREGYAYTKASRLIPIVINVMNFPKPTLATPSLLTHRDVETFFHEFGHAVHAMLSSKQLPNLNGFHVEWDFVEFPSQIFENWTWEKDVLKIIARHYKTNKSLPKKDADTLWKLKTWLGGYHVVRQNEFAYLDMVLHTRSVPRTVAALDILCARTVSQRTALPKQKDYRMYASFGHIFAGGYSAGYYSYLWAEILEADCYEKLRKEGILKRSTGTLFARKILEPGTSYHGEALFKSLMKRAPTIQPLLRKYSIV